MPRKLTPEQALKIRQKRDAEDPALHYTAPITLQRAGECKARYLCLHAPNQIGKTAWMQYVTSTILRGKNPNWHNFGPCKILLIVPKRAQASKIWGDRLLKKSELFGDMYNRPWIPKRELLKVVNAFSPAGPYPGFIEMKNGSSMMTILSGDPNSWKGLEGMTFDLVVRDEVAGSENMNDEIQPRIVASRSRALAGLQPWGGNILWGATETKHNPEWLEFKQRCIDGVSEHVYFKPTPEEADAYISMKAREEMKDTMSAKSYQIRGSGTLDAGDLVRVFAQQWDDRRHVLAQDYVVQPEDNLHAAYDPGVLMTGLIIGAVNRHRPNQIKVVKTFEHTNENTTFDADCLHSFLLGRRLASLVYDWAAKNTNKNGTPSVLHSLMAALDALGIQPMAGYIQADKRVEVGIDTFRHYLDPNSFDKTAEPLFVINPSQESGCPMLRSEIIGYRSTEPTPNSPGKIVKKNDHVVDCGRYLCRAFPYWSAAYSCGAPTYQAPAPMASDPIIILKDRPPQTIFEYRAEMSKRMQGRNRARVMQLYGPGSVRGSRLVL